VRVAVVVLCLTACGATPPRDARPSGDCTVSALGGACDAACTRGDAVACAHSAERYLNGEAFDPHQSFAYAKQACDAGNALGCSLLGLHYQDGLGTAWAPAKAIAAYDQACRAHEGVGCYNLASMYYSGHGVDADAARGDTLTRLAATYWEVECHGDAPRWCTNLAYVYATDRSKQAQILDLDQRACDHGVLVGCTEALREKLARGAITARGVLDELVKLCTRDEPSACAMAGASLVVGGEGLAADPKRGLGLLERACKLGEKTSCEGLASEYAAGTLVKQDFAVTDRYLNLACDRGQATACLALAQDHHTRDQPDQAARYDQRACQMGNGEACNDLGLAYLAGDGVGKSALDGERWEVEACRMGHVPACGRLIELDHDLPVPQDVRKRLYTQSCREGVKASCVRLEKLP
jgi:TPR repeat protein